MKKHLPVKVFNEIRNTFKAEKQNGFVTAVNARIVHEWLGVKTEYAKWIISGLRKQSYLGLVKYR
jgi:phage anti-repressor protein